MSAFALPEMSLTQVHQQFVAALPAMENVLGFRARRLPRRHRAEAISDGLAACWHAWYGLLRRGKDPRVVGPTGIAANAGRYVQAGRRLGTGSGGRGAGDVFRRKAREQGGLTRLSIDRDGAVPTGGDGGAWREWLARDNAVTPADEAAFRLDFASWLSGLPARKRRMAELLAEGHETGAVARLLGVTPAAVSSARTWLEAKWREFQGEEVMGKAPPARRPVGRPAGSGRGARRQSRRVALAGATASPR